MSDIQISDPLLRPAVVPATPSIPWTVPGRKPEPWASLRAHRTLALWMGGVTAVLGLAVALIAGHPRYLAEASVRVSPNFPKTLQEDVEPRFNSNSDYHDYVQQQVVEIESPQTTADALKLLGAKRSLWQRPGETDYRAAERLMWALKVQAVAGTYLITVGLEGKRAKGLAEIVNAVVASYLARQQGQELNGSDQRVQLLVSRRAQLEEQIDAHRKQESQLGAELGVSTFASGFVSPYDKMVGDANAALDRAGRNLIEVQARLTALQDHQRRMNQLEVDSTAQQMLASDHDVTLANAQLTAQRETAAIELQGLGPNHPGRPALENQIKNIDQEISQTNSAALLSMRAILRQSRDTKQRQEISEAQAHVDEARLAKDGIENEVAKLRASSATFGAKYNQALSNRDEIDRLQKNVQAIDDRTNFLRLEAPSPGFVRSESPASTPDMALKGGRRKIFGLFAVVALMLAVAAPVGVDLIDPKIKTAGELEAVLGFAALGVVKRGSNRPARESIRRVALAIIRERRVSGVRSFVLAPIRGHAGTTALALALAHELNELGRPTVAIEANQFSPDARYVSVHGPHNGLVNGQANGGVNGKAINGNSAGALERKLHSVAGADGRLPERTAICRHLGRPSLTLECIESLVALALATNDIVILDAPPLMDSADAEMLIQMPTAAILVVREGRDVMPDVVAAARTLERLSPPAVGAILNGIAIDEDVAGEHQLTMPLAIAGESPPLESYRA
jgi:succinoglycan biosynthesis transport protein ExoP